MKRTVTLLFFVLLPFVDLQACQCFEKPTVKKSIKQADLVIVGEVLNKEIVLIKGDDTARVIPEDSVEHLLFKGLIEARFTVRAFETYKGASQADTVVIATGIGGGDCGYSFSVGEKYILYAKKQEGTEKFDEALFSTNICTRTTKYNEIELKEIKRFREIKKDAP